MDAYRTLGVPPDADRHSVREAYRKRIAQAHPAHARSSTDLARRTHEAAQLNEAYRTLRDPALRRAYDLTLHRTNRSQEPHRRQQPLAREPVAHRLLTWSNSGWAAVLAGLAIWIVHEGNVIHMSFGDIVAAELTYLAVCAVALKSGALRRIKL